MDLDVDSWPSKNIIKQMEINSWKLEDFHGSKSFQGACLPPNFNSTRPLSRSTLQPIMPRNPSRNPSQNPSLSYLAPGDNQTSWYTTLKIRVAGLLGAQSTNPEPKFRLVKAKTPLPSRASWVKLEKKYWWIKMPTILPNFDSSNQWKCQDQLSILGHEIFPVPRCQQFPMCHGTPKPCALGPTLHISSTRYGSFRTA